MVDKVFSPRSTRNRLLVLAGLLLAVACGAYFGRAPRMAPGSDATGFGDIDFHRLIVSRLQAGDRYYEVYGTELRRHGYATRPIFHWRLPTLDSVLAVLPDARMGKGLLVALTLTMLLIWSDHIRRELGLPLACGAILLLMPSLASSIIGDCYYQHDLWVGVLIALSLALHGRSAPASIACGLAALAIRELALPYVLVMCAMAAWERKARQVAAWALGMAAFAVFLAVHAIMVSSRLLPNDPSDPAWVRFGGWLFLSACSSWLFIGLTPFWLTAGLTVLGVYGAFASRNVRLFAVFGLYLAAFLVAGKQFNDYWGLIYAPLLAIGLVYSIPAVTQLVRGTCPGQPVAPAPPTPEEPPRAADP